jgi:ElaB/YqjD/DUF883 family membrane-anchored ribosome-binding protein
VCQRTDIAAPWRDDRDTSEEKSLAEELAQPPPATSRKCATNWSSPKHPEGIHMTKAPISSEFTSMAHETIDRAAPNLDRVEEGLRGAAARAADGTKALQESAMQAGEENLRKARSFIESNPLATAGIAFATGALLGALVRR